MAGHILGLAAAALLLPMQPPHAAQCPRHAPLQMDNKFSMARPSSPIKSGGSAPNSVRSRRANLLRELEAPITPREPVGSPMDDPAAPLALTAVRAADARKARDISALRVGHLTSATNFFVNVVGGSKAQINAIVKSIEDDVDEQFDRRAHRQGKAVSGWVCLDYDEVTRSP